MLTVTKSQSKFGNPKEAVKRAKNLTALETGVRIASQAKLLCPVDQGQLRNSLSASNQQETKLLNDRDGESAPEIDTTGLAEGEVYVGSNSDHAIFQEYGTIKMVAQPYLRPSAELILSQKTVEKIMSDYSAVEMDRELKKRREVV